MQIIKVDLRLGMSGNNIEFNQEAFFGLIPGSKVVQIGNGKENGTIRTDNFITPVTYKGSLMVQFEKLEKMYAFQVECNHVDEDVFFLYGSTGKEIFTECGNKTNNAGFMRFYAPEFTLYEDQS